MNPSIFFRHKIFRFLLYVACASLMIALMNVGAKLSDKNVAPPQLPNHPTVVEEILCANPYLRSVAEEWLAIDYIFIAAYVITAFLIAFSISTDERPVAFRYLGYLAALLVLAGAVFDVCEDLAQGAVYRSHNLLPRIQVFTALKFLFFFIGFGLLIVLAAVKGGPIGQSLARWTRALYFLRIPIVVTSLLIVLPFMDASSPSFAEMSRGIFAVEGSTELFFAGFAAFSSCWSAMIVSRVILAYSNERFSLTQPPTGKPVSLLATPPDEIRIDKDIEWTTIAVWSIPGWFFVSRVVAVADYQTLSWKKWVIASMSSVAAFAILGLADLFRLHEKDPSQKTDHAFVLPTDSWLARKASNRPPLIGDASLFWRPLILLGPGYAEVTPVGGVKRIRSGHIIATGLVALLGVIYIGLGYISKPSLHSLSVAVAAYVAILLGLILWIVAGLTFFLDRYRVPVLLAIIAAVSVSGTLADTDHYYPVPHADANAAPGLTPKELLAKWEKLHRDDHSPLVVVTAAGGGIQAAAWTAIVLTQLETHIPQFRKSIVLISSVSGGSVGTMYFAGTYIKGCETADVVNLAASSSLRQVAWGFAYPDAWRIVFGTWAGKDRAIAMEEAWREYRHPGSEEKTEWCGAGQKISAWRGAAAKGEQPAVIFNATITETGQRFLITNFKAEDYSNGRTLAQINVPSQQAAAAFDRSYPDHDLDITTAARLSATFPVVTPVARPDEDSVDGEIFHAADGGYFDNYGIASAIEWLREAEGGDETKTKALLTNHQLLWILIRAAPLHTDENRSAESPSKTRRWGSAEQALAPLTTLINVRSASQWERDLAELEQVYERLNGEPPKSDSDRGNQSSAQSRPKMQIVSFEYRDDHPPLSWHLTSVQRLQLKCNWDGNRNNRECKSQGWQDSSIKKVRDAFGLNGQP